MIHIYTGNGKGKTTAALGLAIRASGHNYRVYIGQFMKGQIYGELYSLKKLGIDIERFGNNTCIYSPLHVRESDILKAKNGYKRALEIIKSNKYDIIILDEICICPYFNLLTDEEIINLIKIVPENCELILTGRYAPQTLYPYADLVTEMKEIKHYYQKGLLARDGIEK